MDATTAGKPHGSNTLTKVGDLAVRVVVEPVFMSAESDPHGTPPRYLFAYRVRLVNESSRRATLRTRRWEIVDADGVLRIVEGEGVVGQQPTLAPAGAWGDQFEYASYCPLETAWGTMQGVYRFELEPAENAPLPMDDRLVEVQVGRFFLVSDDASRS